MRSKDAKCNLWNHLKNKFYDFQIEDQILTVVIPIMAGCLQKILHACCKHDLLLKESNKIHDVCGGFVALCLVH